MQQLQCTDLGYPDAVKNDTPDLLKPDNVVRLRWPLPEEELSVLEGKDVPGEFDPPPTRKKRSPKPDNLRFDL